MYFVSFNLILRPFCAIDRSAPAAAFNALGVIHAADNVIAHARQVLHASTTDKHDRMLLQIVLFAWDICNDFHAV